jgi:hypothetical protein
MCASWLRRASASNGGWTAPWRTGCPMCISRRTSQGAWTVFARRPTYTLLKSAIQPTRWFANAYYSTC